MHIQTITIGGNSVSNCICRRFGVAWGIYSKASPAFGF
jgi:hypothetical protein